MKRLLIVVTAGVLALSVASMPNQSLAAATAQCGRSWSIVASPSPAPGDNKLDSVAALTRDDVWAVGSQSQQVGGPAQALVEHWNGTAWTVLPSPNVAEDSNVLLGVAAASPTDVWAVGSHSPFPPTETSPSPGADINVLSAVAVVSADDVWAVGSVGHGGRVRTLIEHWDGSRWTVVASPSPAGAIAELLGATAVSPTEIWAVGDSSPDGVLTRTLTERWDGRSWTVLPSENTDPVQNYLYDVDAAAADGLWAAGSAGFSTLIERGNQAGWAVVASPTQGAGSILRGVVALGPANAWVVGYWRDSNGDDHTLSEYWDGQQWLYLDSPDSALPDNDLLAASAAGGTIWAVGHAFIPGPNPSSTLVERVCPG